MTKELRLELEHAIMVNDGKGSKIVISKLEEPSILYKYYSLNGNSISSLQNNTIHLSHAFNLNDIMEGNFALSSGYESFFNKPPSFNKKYRDVLEFSQEELPTLMTDVAKDWGVFSMCKTFDNDLIWSHYTNEEGFCVEFKTDLLFVSLIDKNKFLVPVSYDLDKINFDDYIFEEQVEDKVNVDAWMPFVYPMLSKESCWSYEKEWRILVGKKFDSPMSHKLHLLGSEINEAEKKTLKNRNLSTNPDAIEKVILAPFFFNNKRFTIIDDGDPDSITYAYIIDKDPYKDNSKDLISFMSCLKKDYGNKIFQVNKKYNSNKLKFERALDFKIEILEIAGDSVKIKRSKVQ